MRRALPLVVAASCALWGSAAWASGFDAPTLGSAQSGPVARDAAATWWNPGRLTALDQTELQVGLGVILGSISYQRDLRTEYQYADNLDFAAPVDVADLDPAKFGKQEKVRTIPVGPAFDAYLAIPAIRDRLVVGLGVGIPYVAVLDLPRHGPQRFAGQSILLATPHTSLALAVKAHRVLSIGAGISYVFGTLSMRKVQDFGAVDTFGDALAQPPIGQTNDFGADAPPVVRELDVLAREVEIPRAFAHGVSFHAGLALQPTDKLSLGLVYHHGARLTFRGKFRLDMDDDFFTQDLAAQGLAYPAVVKGNARVKLRLPKRITLGVGYAFNDRFSLDGYVAYVFYQDFDRIRIRFSSPGLAQPGLGIGENVDQDLIRDWKGAVNTEINGRISATKKLLVSVTAGYNSPASPDATLDVFSPDGHRIILGTGIAYRFNPRAALLADLEGQFIVPRTNTNSDYDLGNGTYNMFIGAFTLHGQFRFAGRGSKKSKPKAAGEAAPPAVAPQPAPEAAPPPASPPPATTPLESAPVEAPSDPATPAPPPPPPPANTHATLDSGRDRV